MFTVRYYVYNMSKLRYIVINCLFMKQMSIISDQSLMTMLVKFHFDIKKTDEILWGGCV